MHEKTLLYAIEHASLSPNNKAEMAGSMQNAFNWLCHAVGVKEQPFATRSLLMELNPNIWNSTIGSLLAASEQARSRHGLALYYSFTILCGIVETRRIEVTRPRMAARVLTFRHQALAFLDDMLVLSRQLSGVGPDSDTPLEPRDEKLKSTSADVNRVEDSLTQLGYNICPYGVGVALLSLESGYSHCETASHLALATLARDAKEAGLDIMKMMALATHARAMIDILTEFKNVGLMREELFKNDARAILGVVIVEKGQSEWISGVLSDPVVAQDRVATSRINYSEMTG